jgi:hypothetical protein
MLDAFSQIGQALGVQSALLLAAAAAHTKMCNFFQEGLQYGSASSR